MTSRPEASVCNPCRVLASPKHLFLILPPASVSDLTLTLPHSHLAVRLQSFVGIQGNVNAKPRFGSQAFLKQPWEL